MLAWQAPTFLNGFTSVGGSWRDVSFYKDRGRVYFKGLILAPSSISDNTCFTLPVGFRPDGFLRLKADHSGAQSQGIGLVIYADGTVRANVQNGNWLLTDGLSFRVAD